jgi:hypothetical protein
MGKLTIIISRSHQGLTRNLAGRLTFLQREPTGCNQDGDFQIRSAERRQGRVRRFPGLFIGSGMLCHGYFTVILN